tara:strand:- start:258 stop:452 length:195 start_codon:yes stop_codon:yes gene_type:complete
VVENTLKTKRFLNLKSKTVISVKNKLVNFRKSKPSTFHMALEAIKTQDIMMMKLTRSAKKVIRK